MSEQKTALVVSAHSADFVWRAGGAIALYAKRGYKVLIVCLSYGERGESAKLWKLDGMTLEKVKTERRKEAEKAAKILGGEPIFFDIGDYPMRATDEHLFRLTEIYRKYQPEFTLSHSLEDPYNFDHPMATHLAQEARITAQAWGHNPGEEVHGASGFFLFEPHQTEQCNWKPEVILDITEVWDTKYEAIEAMAGQEHLWDYYTRVALQRGVQGKRNSGRAMKYGEAYQRIFPLVTGEFL
ncbi:MAG: PIG-L family deacetylase [Proteobacteria bacterium]|nr:PIG-L family deacetylase [Pseudomonadota bacterium]